jgi:hypothetical protein
MHVHLDPATIEDSHGTVFIHPTTQVLSKYRYGYVCVTSDAIGLSLSCETTLSAIKAFSYPIVYSTVQLFALTGKKATVRSKQGLYIQI